MPDGSLLPPGTYWSAVAAYADGSAILGIYGPYARKANAEDAITRLRQAGIYVNESWTTEPVRSIDLGEPDSDMERQEKKTGTRL